MNPSSTNTSTENLIAYFDTGSGGTTNRGIVFYAFASGTGATQTTSLGTVSGSTWYAAITKATTGKTNADYDKTSNYDVGLETPTRSTLTSGGADSEHLALAYNGSVAVLVYYDQTSPGYLRMLYNTSPLTTPGTWTAITNPIDTSAGTYPAVALGSDGSVHIAYLDSENSRLKYAYLSSASNSATKVVKTVDGLFSSGMFNSIAVRQFGTGDFRPVIATYSSAYYGSKYAVRVAFPSSAIGTNGSALGNGYDSATGKMTTNWEVVAVPSISAPQQVQTFVENNGTAVTSGDPVIGLNGSTLQEIQLRF